MDSFGARSTLNVGDSNYEYFRLDAVEDGHVDRLPYSLKILLENLLRHEDGRDVTREDILDRVWGYEVFPSTRTIDNFIVRIRKRFERDPEEPAHFHTVRGVGYRFTTKPEEGTENNE